MKLSKTLSYGSRLKLSKTLSYGSRLKLSKTLSYGSRFRSCVVLRDSNLESVDHVLK
ncbi:hypothetical protein [Leptospira interrogans]|uniref:hypothetical protein n=1 Tax=Leptospira interrogans TaxID=173 RepID=UPI0012F7DB9A|nr:hypothetical protein [Leptospira interrogans]